MKTAAKKGDYAVALRAAHNLAAALAAFEVDLERHEESEKEFETRLAQLTPRLAKVVSQANPELIDVSGRIPPARKRVKRLATEGNYLEAIEAIAELEGQVAAAERELARVLR